jgi:hypothetical protein
MPNSLPTSPQPQSDSAQDQPSGGRVNAIFSVPIADLVDGENALAAYHEFVEASIYARSLKSVGAARGFHSELIARAQALLAFADDNNGMASIDAEIQAANAKLAGTSAENAGATSAFARARELEPHGFGLLNMQGPFDIPTLKSAYRAAVKRHHPDVGGDTAIMQHINEVYGLFFAALQQDAAREQTDANQGCRTVAQSVSEVMNETRRTIFLADVDDFAADAAYTLLQALPLPIDSSLDSSVFPSILRLAAMLGAMGKAQEARAALDVGETEFARLTARGLNFAHSFAWAARMVAEPKALRLVINHQRQADNALRLGLINRARYDQTMKRLNSNAAEAAAQQANLVAALGAIDFADLPLGPHGPVTPPAGLVPMPDYYARLDDLEATQIDEYQRGFVGHDGALIVKYIFVRLNALLKAVIQGYDPVAALKETQTVRDAALPKSSLQYYAGELGSLLEFFDQQGAEDRKERFAILLNFDKVGRGRSMRVGSTPYSIRISVPEPITLSGRFLQLARQPLEQLRDG